MIKRIMTALLVLYCGTAWGFGWSSSGGGGKRIDLTVSGWTAQGVWSAATTYSANDVVTYNGSTWTAIQGSINHAPSDTSLYWLKSIAKGDAATVSVGTVTQLDHSQSPTVSNAGTSGAAVFNFGIPAGAPGAAGADGKTVLTTSGAPSSGTGVNGDYAYDPATYTMYGPKAVGAWPAGTIIKGADGAGFTGGSDGTYGWLTDSNTSTYSECASGKYGLNFVGGVLYQCSNGTNSVFASGDSLPAQTGNNGKFLTTNGTTASWGSIAAGSGIAISADIPTETGAANLNDSTHVLTVASTTGYTQFTGTHTAWDTTPDAFAFTDLTDVAPSTTQTATPVQITRINYPTAVTATGGTAAICTGATVGTCGTFSASPGNVALNQYVSAQHTSSGSNSTAVNTVVTIGGVSDTFTSTTAAGEAYSDVLFHWDAENTLTAEIGGATGTSYQSTFTTTAKVGEYAIARSTNYGNVSFGISSAQFDPAAGQIGFWYRSSGYQNSSYNYIAQIDYDTHNYLKVMQVSGGGIRATLCVSGTSYYTEYTTVGLSADTWYYITYLWNPGNAGNDTLLTIYNEDGTTFGTASLATIPEMAQPTSFVFGGSVADAARPIVDHFVISNSITRDMWAIRSSNF